MAGARVSHDPDQLSFPGGPPPDPGWADGALSAIREAARRGRPFQAHDLVDEYKLAEPPHHSAWGRVFARARAEAIIRPIGAARSRRRTVAGSLVMVWVGVDDQLPAAETRRAS